MQQTWYRGICVIVLLLAFALRVIGIDFGKPLAPTMQRGVPILDAQAPLHPDEYFYVSIPLEMLANGRTDPRFFENPSFLINLNYLTFALTGEHVPSPAVWDGLTRRSYAPFHLYVIGRVYSALGGLIAVASAIAMGRMVAGRRAGVIAGMLVAVSFPLVQHSHYATTSSLASGFVMLAFAAGIRAMTAGAGWRWLLLMSIAAGLAVGNRYNAAPLGFSIVLAGVWQWRQGVTSWRIGIAWLAFPLVFVITSPHVLLSARTFWEQFSYIYGSYTGSETAVELSSLIVVYEYVAFAGLGGIGAVLAVIGAGLLWRIRPRWLLLLFVYWLPYTIVVLDNNRPLRSDQLSLLVIPLLAVLAALPLARLSQWNQRLSMGVLLATCALPTVMSTQVAVRFSQVDTRYQAQRWLQANLTAETRVHRWGGYNVPLADDRYALSQQFNTAPIDTTVFSSGIVLLSDASLLRQVRLTGQPLSAVVDAQLRSLNGELIYTVERPSWVLSQLRMHNAAYWHHPAIYVVCVRCRVSASSDFMIQSSAF